MMTDFRKCSICGITFSYIGKSYCARCALDLEDGYVKARDFLEEHPGARMMDIVKGTEIPEKIVIQLIDEGRLVSSNNFGAGESGKVCMMCRKPIPTGDICRECSIKTTNLLSGKQQGVDVSAKSADKEFKGKSSKRMYTRDIE